MSSNHPKENLWNLPSNDEMVEYIYQRYIKQKKFKNWPKLIVNKMLLREGVFLDNLHKVLAFYRKEMGINTIDEVSITQPIISEHVKRICKVFSDIIDTREVTDVNGVTMKAWFPTDDGGDKAIAGKGDIIIKAKNSVSLEAKPFGSKLSRHHVAQAMLQAYAGINKEVVGKERGISMSVKQSRTVNDQSIRKSNNPHSSNQATTEQGK